MIDNFIKYKKNRRKKMRNILEFIMVNIFGRIADRRGKQIRKMMETDPEMVAAKKQIDEATERMKKRAKEIEEKTGLKLRVV